MKTTLLVLCLLAASAAFGQSYGQYANSQAQFFEPPTHPQHAFYAPMATEQSINGGGSYLSAQGERPVSDFPQPAAVPLGDAARELRKQHDKVKKSAVVYIN